MNIKTLSIKEKEAVAATTEYWYLRCWDENKQSYAYPYRETNNQKYILKPEGQEWKVYMNLRPQPKTSIPHRWNQTYAVSGVNVASTGGSTILNILPGTSRPYIMPKPAGWKNGYSDFKVVISQFNDLIIEKVYPF
ncbi:MAG: hypothetical protein JW944_05610 [Deltaproteobacteria bacterium]|nr:hypothetical protein [Deltaproteobacteria bacterium]